MTSVDANQNDVKDEQAQGGQQAQGGEGKQVQAAGEETAERAENRPMTIQEAARKGGTTTKQRYGPDFYSRIGRKGGQRVAKERGPEFYSEIGRKGGEARVAQSRRLEKQSDENKAQE